MEKRGRPGRDRGTILFVHGSSMASQPTFDLQVPGRADSSAMDYFAGRGYDTWCVDMEGYGRSDKDRDIKRRHRDGADDCSPAATTSTNRAGTRPLLVYGISSGALRAALFAQRHPERVRGSRSTPSSGPARAARRWPSGARSCRNSARRTAGRSTAPSCARIFTRDHPGTADDEVIEAFADAILALDDSVPTGTYVDMCANLPVVDPAKITVPTIIMRGEYDGIAGLRRPARSSSSGCRTRTSSSR